MKAEPKKRPAARQDVKRRALFLMHNYNDIDHMTPVIDALMKTGAWKCSAIFYPYATEGSIRFESDWRLGYLRDAHGVEVARIEDLDGSAKWSMRLWQVHEWLTTLCKRTPPLGRLWGRDLRGLLPWFLALAGFGHFLRAYFSKLSPTGRRLWRMKRPDVIVVDWGQTHLLVYPIIGLAHARGVRVLQIPHGAWTYEGIYSHHSQFDPAKLMKRTRLPDTRADIMVIDNLYKAYRSEYQGISRERMRFLGLARFSPDWIDILSGLPKGTAAIPDTGKPKVVWFPTWLMACDLEGVDASLAVLEEFTDRIDIVLKVHTRNPSHEMEDYGRRLKPGSKIRLVANEEESFAVTRWADVVLITQSSIVYDAFILGKPVVYLKYTHDFDCMWDVDGVGETVPDPAGLRRILSDIAEGRYKPPYSAPSVARYLRLAVHGGLDPDAVLPAYLTLFDQAVNGAALVAGMSFEEAERLWHALGRPITGIELRKQAA